MRRGGGGGHANQEAHPVALFQRGGVSPLARHGGAGQAVEPPRRPVLAQLRPRRAPARRRRQGRDPEEEVAAGLARRQGVDAKLGVGPPGGLDGRRREGGEVRPLGAGAGECAAVVGQGEGGRLGEQPGVEAEVGLCGAARSGRRRRHVGHAASTREDGRARIGRKLWARGPEGGGKGLCGRVVDGSAFCGCPVRGQIKRMM